MRLPSFRVRTLMTMVVVAALLVWGSMMGSRSYDYYGRARMYAGQERGWRSIAARKTGSRGAFASECAVYFEGLTRKYRWAMWRPWLVVEPDPWAPGVEAGYRQEVEAGRQKEAIPSTVPYVPHGFFKKPFESSHQKAPTKNEK
jgi:hypothetical protein